MMVREMAERTVDLMVAWLATRKADMKAAAKVGTTDNRMVKNSAARSVGLSVLEQVEEKVVVKADMMVEYSAALTDAKMASYWAGRLVDSSVDSMDVRWGKLSVVWKGKATVAY
jgi:hypothetical protein